MKFLSIALLLAGSLGASSGANASTPFTLDVSPGVSMAPADVRVRTRVVRDPDNRLLEIAADSGQFFRSSTVTLDGDSAPSVTEVAFKGLPGGEYQISVALHGSRGVRATLSRTIMVIPSVSER
jgi:hypothetical protein